MRCECCNKLLSDKESTRKFKDSGNYSDVCDECLTFMPEIETITRREFIVPSTDMDDSIDNDLAEDFWNDYEEE